MDGTVLQLRRGSTAEHAAFTGAIAEVTVDTDKNAVVVHDGQTEGGFPAARASDVAGLLADIATGNASIAALYALVSSIQAATASGHLGYPTQAALYADLTPIAGTLAEVTNDPTSSLNGLYIKIGPSMAGSWVMASYDRLTALSGLLDQIWWRQVNITFQGLDVTIRGGSLPAVTFDVAACYMVNDKDEQYVAVPAIADVCLVNFGALYLDVSQPASPVWVTNDVPPQKGVSSNLILMISNGFGVLSSPIASIQAALFEAQGRYTFVWRNQINPLIWADDKNGPGISINGVSGNTVTISWSGGYIIGGDAGSYSEVPPFSNVSLNNTQCLYLDITTPASPTWSVAADPGDQKGYKSRIICFTNIFGRVFSPVAALSKQIRDAEDRYNAGNVSITRSALTVAPSGGDFATITAALQAITNNCPGHQTEIFVRAGTYVENGQNGLGLELLDWVNIHGAGADHVTLIGPEDPQPNQYVRSVIHKPANSLIEGMTLWQAQGRYCIHCDLSIEPMRFTARNLVLRQYDYNWDIGIGMYPSQTVAFENVVCQGKGIYAHGAIASRLPNQTWTLRFSTCQAWEMCIDDMLEYVLNSLDVEGCDLDHIYWLPSHVYYDAQPSDPLYNRGYYHPSICPKWVGNKIGRVVYPGDPVFPLLYPSDGGFTLGTLFTQRMTLPGLNFRAYNTGGAPISQGKAVVLQADPGQPSPEYPSSVLRNTSVALWAGSGILAGFSEDVIAAPGVGSIQKSGNPYVLADASSTAISFGDPLELSASGSCVKHASGQIVGYALMALASGTGLIPMRMLPLA
jgi:hypothetical protein